LYHPRQNELHDRVFIFAHELGHAIHFALTGNVDVLPDGFDKFNDSFYPKLETLKDKQEAFADTVAFAILNIKGFGTHFPTRFTKDMSPNFARYVRELCTHALQEKGQLTEPLPMPNPLWMRNIPAYPPR
jgi:Zn-dependent peptidase ImmA (M78 family)